jgi:hypothetical protein
VSAAADSAPLTLRDLLLSVREKHGELTPRAVLEDARPVDSPLHSQFPDWAWVDSEAAEHARLELAHRLIVKVRVRFIDSAEEPRSVRAFVAYPTADRPAPAYVPTEEIAADPVASAIVRDAMQREWRTLYRRYKVTTGFLDMVRADVRPEFEVPLDGEDEAGTG